ncbi:tetratricopeptide repeat protein [Saccharopolyspora indica]|uniref:tetratricopeptide repeat protein n=1 Tax=Saccharopolyspora indica TaxID=1229659 RepID=UPI0022EA44A3|nr:tetratricopeptide repeat protein [Saccharopolyspora indica]MDA3644077.1 tetratricopeptide repeat protein [Saccharopolyspora indica]
MSSELEQRRDEALADLIDLERQVEEGEIPRQVGERLRADYERRAAAALNALESPRPEKARPVRRSRTVPALYALAAVVAVTAAVLVLPNFVGARPENGFVTGNEAVAPPPSAPPRDLSTVTDEEMEAVIAQNPDVVGMRLALAKRYLAVGEHDKASEHLGEALKQQPENPEVRAWSGWLLFQIGEPAAAAEYVDRALAIDPGDPWAAWFKANILLDGFGDVAGAQDVLMRLQQRLDLDPELREKVDTALRRNAGGGGS